MSTQVAESVFEYPSRLVPACDWSLAERAWGVKGRANAESIPPSPQTLHNNTRPFTPRSPEYTYRGTSCLQLCGQDLFFEALRRSHSRNTEHYQQLNHVSPESTRMVTLRLLGKILKN